MVFKERGGAVEAGTLSQALQQELDRDMHLRTEVTRLNREKAELQVSRSNRHHRRRDTPLPHIDADYTQGLGSVGSEPVVTGQTEAGWSPSRSTWITYRPRQKQEI